MLQQVLRNHNVAIMDIVNLHIKSPTLRSTFNRVKNWMKVYSLAEISSVDGFHISTAAWNGTRESFTNRLWANQPKPNEPSIQAWRKIITELFLKHRPTRVTRTTQNLLLKQSLGTWYSDSAWIHPKWKESFSRLLQQHCTIFTQSIGNLYKEYLNPHTDQLCFILHKYNTT